MCRPTYNILFAETETLPLSVYEPIAMPILLGGIVPQFDRGVELGGRVWYPLELLHISYNFFTGTEMLSLSVNEPIAIQILHEGTVPKFGEGVELGGRVWYPVKAHRNGHNLLIETDTLSLLVCEP